MFSNLVEGINVRHSDPKKDEKLGRGRVIGIREAPTQVEVQNQDGSVGLVETTEIHAIVCWENKRVPAFSLINAMELANDEDFDSYSDDSEFGDDDDDSDSEDEDNNEGDDE